LLASNSSRTGKPISAKTVKDGDLAEFKTVFGCAVSNRKIATNLAEGATVKLGKPKKPRVRLYDDRLDLFIGGTPLMSLPRGRAHLSGKDAQVVNYRHVIHALRKNPMALLNLVYRDQLFPREAFRRTFDALLERLPGHRAKTGTGTAGRQGDSRQSR
jgi:hypothetical protein